MTFRRRTSVAILTLLAASCTSQSNTESASNSLSHPSIQTEAPTPVFKPGIQKGLAAPPGFVAVNEWQGLAGRNDLVQIWAGAPRASPDQGELVMRHAQPGSDASHWQVYSSNTYLEPSPDGELTIVSALGHWLWLRATDGARARFNWHSISFSDDPTCAPMQSPWASPGCPESVWVREVVAAAVARITGVTQGIEPQRDSAFLVELDGYRFSFGAISKEDMRRMSGYFTMGEFGAGMGGSGRVDGVPLYGNIKSGHWSWVVNGFAAEIYRSHAPRSTIAKLLMASIGVR